MNFFGRTGKDLRGTLLRSSNVENDDEKHHHELLRRSGTMDNRNDEPTMKELKDLGERHLTGDNSFLRQTLK